MTRPRVVKPEISVRKKVLLQISAKIIRLMQQPRSSLMTDLPESYLLTPGIAATFRLIQVTASVALHLQFHCY